jgi:hypothetical protein
MLTSGFNTSFNAAWHRHDEGADQAAGDGPLALFQRVAEPILLFFCPCDVVVLRVLSKYKLLKVLLEVLDWVEVW